jgi:regulator of protease activity HflC (stomatin/prohibitin superfamily)
METPLILLVVLIVIISIFFSSLKIVQEYERGVVFRLGRLLGVKGPGWFFIIPFGIDRYVKVDLRTVTMEVPTQETITRDNVSVKVNAVLYFRVADPTKSVVNVIDFIRATLQISQTTLRSVIGQSDLDDLLSRRDKINESLQKIIDTQTEPWGIKVSSVEVKDVELPQSMQRAMARQAEAEREKRAKIISAEGELMASEKLAEAAHIMGQEKQTMQLRYLQTLSEISVEKNSTIIFPLPIELMNFLGSKFDASDSPAIKTENEKRVANEVNSTQRQARRRSKETSSDGEIKE